MLKLQFAIRSFTQLDVALNIIRITWRTAFVKHRLYRKTGKKLNKQRACGGFGE
jgi:hypothetical protein